MWRFRNRYVHRRSTLMTYKARLHVRCTEDDRELLKRAAAIEGDSDEAKFVMRVLRVQARAVIARVSEAVAETLRAVNVSALVTARGR